MRAAWDVKNLEPTSWDVLMIDLVGYSELGPEAQVREINFLTDVVRQCVHSWTKDPLLFLPTGDGMAVGFRGFPQRPLMLASLIHQAYERRKANDRYLLKIGINSGWAFAIKDITNRKNIAGSGINMAARILSCCSGGHILVAESVGKELKTMEAWRDLLTGAPYEFVVKHRKRLRAYNFVDEANRVGLAAEPRTNMVFEPAYTPLRATLGTLNIGPDEELRASAVLERLGTSIAVDTVIVELPISGFVGVPPSQVHTISASGPPNYPVSVEALKSRIKEPEPNHPKVYVANWEPPLSDGGDILTLFLGKTDFWTSLAVDAAASTIKAALEEGTLDLKQLPRRLAFHMAIISADSKLILARRTDTVHYEKHKWSATFEENLDWKKDLGPDGKINIDQAVRRGLRRMEEGGLPTEIVDAAEIRFLALGIEWANLAGVLVGVVKLPRTESAQILDYMRSAGDQEHRYFSSVDFTFDSSLSLLVNERYAPPEQPGEADYLHRTSRIRILTALFSEFGFGETLQFLERAAEIKRRAGPRPTLQ